MVRFSCFQANLHPHKHKKTLQPSSEAMQKTLEDSSPKQAISYSSDLATENKPCLKEGGHIHNITDNVTDYSPTEHDCGSEEMEGKYSSECDIVVHKKAQMRKSLSLGCGLNWEDRTSGAEGSEEEEIEQRFSFDGSGNRSRTVLPDSVNNNNGFSVSDQIQEPMLSESVQVGSDFAKNMSIFSIGDPEQTEKEGSEKENDINVSGEGYSGEIMPHTPHVIVKSNSLPRLGSPLRCSTSFIPHSRSADDVLTLDSRKNDMMHEVGGQVQYQERENLMHNNDKNTGDNNAEETYENYNYVDSAKDWIIPVSDGEDRGKGIVGETSCDHWEEVPAKDFRLRRIEEWVVNLQQCAPLEEYSDSAPSCDPETPKGSGLVEDPSVSKLAVKVNPGMEAAKRYISSLNPTATAAQLTNLGLVVIPFFSAFSSLKALNLSGNAIVRIAAGALPRGLHILNLSKNNISIIEGLRDLTRLRVLDLSYNRILRIGHGLAACSSIKELYLAGNKISEVEGLHRLLKLNVLDLRFNKISTTKCLGQLAANYNCLQALSLEGNPAQKNVGDEQLKKYVLSLLPHLTYYNRKPIKLGTTKDAADRSARLGIGSHQGHRVEAKTVRKPSHGLATQKVASSNHGRKSQALVSPKPSRRRLPPSGMKTTAQGHHLTDFSSRLASLRNDLSFPRSRSEGNLGVL